MQLVRKMTYEIILVLIGFLIALAAIFPRPPRKAKGDPKFFTKPPEVIVPVKILNQIGMAFEDFLGFRLIPLNNDEMISLIKSAPTSDLFGPQDEIIVGIKKFMKGLAESKPTAFGVFANNRYRRINLQKRALVMDYIVKNPKIAEIPFNRPIFITGMMRTGSTLLFNLLHQDPNSRSPYLWEMAGLNPNPTPPPTSPNGDSRIKIVEEGVKMYSKFIPSLLSESAKSHFTGATEIEECLFAMLHQGVHQVLLPMSGNDYLEWFLDDKRKEYVYIYWRRYLQMLTSGYAPKSHWNLKAPIHALYISILAKVFPEALFVITHRDPYEVVPSTSKMFELGTYFFYPENTLDRRWIGEVCMRMSETMCNRIMEYREEQGSDQFFDVRYPDLLANPIQMVKDIYKKAGHEVTPEFEANMKKYLEANPQGKHGRNSYSLELYGLSKEDMDKRFEKYRKTYNV